MKDQYDVLVLGSSRAHHHYVPKIIEDSLGVTFYNAGYDGNGIIMMTGIYRMIIQRYQPKLIVYDVETDFDLFENKDDNNRTRYLAGLKPYYSQPGIPDIFKDVSNEEYYKMFSGLCRYNSVSVSLLMDCLTKRPMDNQGYSPLSGKMIEEPIKKKRVETPTTDSLKLQYMHDFIMDVSERGIPLILVASPKYGAVGSLDFEPIKEICDDYQVPFVDFYTDSVFMANKEWFKDREHLNDTGARIYTNKMVHVLRSNLVL